MKLTLDFLRCGLHSLLRGYEYLVGGGQFEDFGLTHYLLVGGVLISELGRWWTYWPAKCGL